MDSIIKALQQFLTRDVLYILGGGSVIVSTSLYWGVTLPSKLESPVALFVAGIAYVIGYIIQEVVSLTPILTTSHFTPNKFITFIYKKFTNHSLDIKEAVTNNTAFVELYPNLSERQVQQIERTITLKHVGATMGSNWLVSSIFLILLAVDLGTKPMVFIAVTALFCSLFLLLMAWVKGAQQMQMFSEVLEAKKT
jgi:hypothetical protein